MQQWNNKNFQGKPGDKLWEKKCKEQDNLLLMGRFSMEQRFGGLFII